MGTLKRVEVPIAAELITQALTTGHVSLKAECIEGLPKGARLEGVAFLEDGLHGPTVTLTFTLPEIVSVEIGDLCEIMNVVYRTVVETEDSEAYR